MSSRVPLKEIGQRDILDFNEYRKLQERKKELRRQETMALEKIKLNNFVLKLPKNHTTYKDEKDRR